MSRKVVLFRALSVQQRFLEWTPANDEFRH